MSVRLINTLNTIIIIIIIINIQIQIKYKGSPTII